MLGRQANHEGAYHLLYVARCVHVALEEAPFAVDVDLVRVEGDRGAVSEVLVYLFHDWLKEQRLQKWECF
jgi:hypothetical protein